MSADFFIKVPKRFKRAGATKAFTVDLSARLRILWIAGRAYNANDTVRPSVPNGFAFQASATGQAGETEPTWPTVVGGTIIDGSITWTAVLPGTNALDPIASTVWNIVNNDGAMSIGSQSHTNEESTVSFAGGTAGATYRIQGLITTNFPLIYDVDFLLQVD